MAASRGVGSPFIHGESYTPVQGHTEEEGACMKLCDMEDSPAVGKYRLEMGNYSAVMFLCDYHLTEESEFVGENPLATLSTIEVFNYGIQSRNH